MVAGGRGCSWVTPGPGGAWPPDAPLGPLCPREGVVSLPSSRGTSGDAERAVGKFLLAPVGVGKLLSGEMAESQQVFHAWLLPTAIPVWVSSLPSR